MTKLTRASDDDVEMGLSLLDALERRDGGMFYLEAAEARRNVGVWFKMTIGKYPPQKTRVRQINKGQLTAFAPAGSFEALPTVEETTVLIRCVTRE